jgi:hypothetical protein
VRLVKAAVTLRGIVTKERADALRGTPTTVQTDQPSADRLSSARLRSTAG